MTEMNPVVEDLLMIHKIILRGLSISIQKCDEYLRKQGIPSGEVSKYFERSSIPDMPGYNHPSERIRCCDILLYGQ